MKRAYFVTVEIKDGWNSYDDYFITEAEEGKEKETFYEKMKELYCYEDEDFNNEENYFERADEVFHSLSTWSQIDDQEVETLKRWFSKW